jgi:hypothetical protein
MLIWIWAMMIGGWTRTKRKRRRVKRIECSALYMVPVLLLNAPMSYASF